VHDYVLHPLRLSSVVHHRTREYCSCSVLRRHVLDCAVLTQQTTFNHGHVRSLENAPFRMWPSSLELATRWLRRTPTINSFKRKLKTYLFISAFNWFYFSFSYYVLTFVLHRCSYFCNRRTIIYLWYDDMNRFLNFGSVSVRFGRKINSIWNEFGSVLFENAVWFRYSYLLLI